MLLLIILAVFGVLAFTRNELKISNSRVVTGDACRVVGGILLAGAAATLILGGLFGLGALLIAIVYGWMNAEVIDTTQKVKN